ncbi:hypothetical protein [Sphingomonas sp. 1P08PE]|uniref:hypothetical protein n=1 Tax=Sphingomonas sp. 1P08PE TaxID=554122 RepID=UPI0039A1EA6A
MRLRAAAACLAVLPLVAAAQSWASPWFGTWKLRSSNPDEKPETLIYSEAGVGAMRMESVEAKSVLVTNFDGKPAADIGEGAAKGNALVVKAISPTSYRWTFLKAGKPFVSGRNSLAADLKTFSEVSWLVAKPTETITLIYDRQ